MCTLFYRRRMSTEITQRKRARTSSSETAAATRELVERLARRSRQMQDNSLRVDERMREAT